MAEEYVALFLDFENLAISADQTYPSRRSPLALEAIVDYASAKGNLCVRKAYADWSKPIFRQYHRKLMEQGFELVYLPRTSVQGKNGSDVRLAIDVMECMERYSQIGIFIIGSGDTDFIALLQRLKARGHKAIVLGFDYSIGRYLKVNASEYRSLEDLIGQPEEDTLASDLLTTIDPSYGRELMVRLIKNREGDAPVPMSRLKLDLLKLDSSFSEKKLGFPSFKPFIQSLVGDVVERIEISPKDDLPEVHLVEQVPHTERKEEDERDLARSFLIKNLRFIEDKGARLQLAGKLIEEFERQPQMSMREMINRVHRRFQSESKNTIRKYINTLFTGKAFIPIMENNTAPLLSRPYRLKRSVVNAEQLEEIYLERIATILTNRYAAIDDDLDDEEIIAHLIDQRSWNGKERRG